MFKHFLKFFLRGLFLFGKSLEIFLFGCDGSLNLCHFLFCLYLFVEGAFNFVRDVLVIFNCAVHFLFGRIPIGKLKLGKFLQGSLRSGNFTCYLFKFTPALTLLLQKTFALITLSLLKLLKRFLIGLCILFQHSHLLLAARYNFLKMIRLR